MFYACPRPRPTAVDEQTAFNAAAQAVAPSVVQIETFAGLEKVDGEITTTVPTTGTIVDKDGWIISSLFSFPWPTRLDTRIDARCTRLPPRSLPATIRES